MVGEKLKKPTLFLAGLIWLASIAAVAMAADETALPPEPESIETAVVTLDGQPLFQVRGMAGYSAEKRANAIEARIEVVAEDPAYKPESIVVTNLSDRSNLMAGDTLLAGILDADAATEKLPRALMADRAKVNILRAIDRYRHDRSANVLLRRTGLAAAATAIFVFLMFGVGRLNRILVNMAEQHLKTRMESLEKRSSSIIESRPLWTAIVGVLSALRVVVIAGMVYFYLNLVLGLYPWTRPLAVQLFAIFVAPLRRIGGNMVGAVPDLAFLIIFTIIIRYVLKITHLFFSGINNGSIVFESFEKELALPTYRIIRFLIICFAAVVAYPYIPGSNSDAFKGVSLFIGVLFSLGSSSLVSNIIASIALTYRRAFKVGDLIKVNDVMGLVVYMRMQATHLRTLHNEIIIIPNSIIVNSHVTNYSLMAQSEGLVLHTTVGIGYSTPWRQVESLLLMAADRTAGLRKDRKPFVRQLALDTFNVQYELGVYCDAPLEMPWIYTRLHKNILDLFNEFGVQIMTPAYEGDPEDSKIVPNGKVFAAPGDQIKRIAKDLPTSI